MLAHAEILTGWRSSSKVMSSAAPLGPVVCAQRTCRQAGAQASGQKERSNQIGTLGALARAHRPLWSQIGLCLQYVSCGTHQGLHSRRTCWSYCVSFVQSTGLFCQINRSLLSNQQVSFVKSTGLCGTHQSWTLGALADTRDSQPPPESARIFLPPPAPPTSSKILRKEANNVLAHTHTE